MLGIYLFAVIFGGIVLVVDLLGLISTDEGDFAESEAGSGENDGVVAPDSNRGRTVYMLLNILRSFVYFCCGFGAVGVFGTLSGKSGVMVLLWSTGTGIVVLLLLRFFSYIQGRTTDSQIKSGELLFAEGEVLVTIFPGQIGRVRIKAGGAYHDRFARGKDSGREYSAGTEVFVVDISQDELVIDTGKGTQND